MQNSPLVSIVDDDESVREATGGLVRSLGFAARTFSSAEELLNSDHLGETSCLITDVQMPGLSGIDLQSCLRAQGRCTPIIFITAFPSESVRAKVLRAGAVGFLSKPYDEEALIGYLDVALGQSEGGLGS